MGDHNASVQHSYTVETVITGSGPHIVRTYPKKAGVEIPHGCVAAMDTGEAVGFDPAGTLTVVKGVSTKDAAAEDPSVTLCVFGGVRRDLVTVTGGAKPDDAVFEKLEERHIYAM
ncbi:hypothetical protein [Halodesulfovibrio aestuarii]|uniref:Head decoration protein n=1 Tax=Halodesulfovibrio aestuarii TaxID=126333 RepID=A0A8G2C7B1_9BACT|nr:hypothetical protein [Halodesulfovibrio aestuarii]SHI60733.1 hypothetical protein SAMN05660830_00441 [Halodesulfovibrio aestuarii]